MRRQLTFGHKGRYGTIVYLTVNDKKIRIGDILPHQTGKNVFFNNGNHLIFSNELDAISSYVKLHRYETV